MIIKKRITTFLLTAVIAVSSFTDASVIYAKKINSANEAKQEALKQLPGATIVEVDSDTEDGMKVYELELVKENKKYDLVYRASDGKLLEYAWEKITISPNNKKALISKDEIKKKAHTTVKNGKILSIFKTRDDGVDIYKIKMSKGSKYYSLKYHARTGVLVEYEWELL